MKQKNKIKQMRELINFTHEFLATYDERFKGEVADELVLGTGVQEGGNFAYIKQLDGGVGCSYWQIEPKTHDDNWEKYLIYRPELAKKFLILAGDISIFNHLEESEHNDFIVNFIKEGRHKDLSNLTLIADLKYAIAHCRLWYFRKSFQMPSYINIEELAEIWKEHYNTNVGKGTAEQFIEGYNAYVK